MTESKPTNVHSRYQRISAECSPDLHLPERVKQAAKRKGMSASKYLIQAVLVQLEKDESSIKPEINR